MLAAHGKPHRVLHHEWTSGVDIRGARARARSRTRPSATWPWFTMKPRPAGSTTSRPSAAPARHGAAAAARWRQQLRGRAHRRAGVESRRAWPPPRTSACTAPPGCRSCWLVANCGPPAPARAGSVYLDLHAYHRAQHGDGFSPFTQAVQIAFALREALAEHREQGGWEARRESYRRRAARIGAILAGLGVTTLLSLVGLLVPCSGPIACRPA